MVHGNWPIFRKGFVNCLHFKFFPVILCYALIECDIDYHRKLFCFRVLMMLRWVISDGKRSVFSHRETLTEWWVCDVVKNYVFHCVLMHWKAVHFFGNELPKEFKRQNSNQQVNFKLTRWSTLLYEACIDNKMNCWKVNIDKDHQDAANY